MQTKNSATPLGSKATTTTINSGSVKGVTLNNKTGNLTPVGFGSHLFRGGAGHKGVKQALLNIIACYTPNPKIAITGYKGGNPQYINSKILLKGIALKYPSIGSIAALHQHTYGLRKNGLVLCGTTIGVQQFVVNPAAFGVPMGKAKMLGGGYTIPKSAPQNLVKQVRKINAGAVV